MSLKTKILGAGMALALSLPLSAQHATTPPLTDTPPGHHLTLPSTTPRLRYELHAYKIRKNGRERPPIPAGTIELRDSSVYASMMFGKYQMLYTQQDDSTFLSYQLMRSLLSKDIIETYVETWGATTTLHHYASSVEPKEEKRQLIGTHYPRPYAPLVIAIHDFLRNASDDTIKTVVYGKSYAFPMIEEPRQEHETRTHAHLGSLLAEESEVVRLEGPLLLYSTKKDGENIPYFFEGRATITAEGFWGAVLNGDWRVTGTLQQEGGTQEATRTPGTTPDDDSNLYKH